MSNANNFVPHIRMRCIASRKVIIQYVKDEVAAKSRYDNAYAPQTQRIWQLFDCRKS